nr:NADH-cytochrome b5 reductase-like protein isoform X5 [Physcomitrium patens]|eukprot:XP_024378860.1 NADH-cytochrome b5 reductase-like protein isoform X5 [Physcomitrella patens]
MRCMVSGIILRSTGDLSRDQDLIAMQGSSLSSEIKAAKSTPLNMKNWVNFTLLESHRVAHNTRIFRGEVVNRRGRLEKITRSYVPVSDLGATGYFDLLIKILPDGMLSQRIARLNPGDSLEMRGPVVELPYKANMKTHLGMIAGDIGITHMVQLIKAIVLNPNDYTQQVSLIYENESPEDILLKEELDKLSRAYPNFKVFYTVNIAGREWEGGVGHITAEMIYKALPHPSPNTLVLVAGPSTFMDRVCGRKDQERYSGQVLGLLKQLGYKKEHVYKF